MAKPARRIVRRDRSAQRQTSLGRRSAAHDDDDRDGVENEGGGGGGGSNSTLSQSQGEGLFSLLPTPSSTPTTSKVNRKTTASPAPGAKKIVVPGNAAAAATGGKPLPPAASPGGGGGRSASAGASTSTAAPPAPTIDRDAFTTLNFSAPTVVNNISNRILYPLLNRARQQQAQMGASSSGTARAGDSSSGGGGNQVRASDGRALFARASARDDEVLANTDYQQVAGELTRSLEAAAALVEELLDSETAALQKQEVRCKRVEIREKRQLAAVRLGLETTSARLQEYENRVSNAQAATAGIEQHLSQSNARVQRGKSVSQLLRYFKMFTSVSPPELSGMLKSISKARVGQREAVAQVWSRGRVSAFNPRFYTMNVTTAAEEGSVDAQRRGSAKGRRDNAGEGNDKDSDDRDDDEDSSSSSDGGGGGGDDEGMAAALKKVKLHRAEAAAVAAGIDALFVARSFTETQVDWCQRLVLLATELKDAASNTKNIDTYVTWLRQELVSDLFFIISCFNDFYEANAQTAIHMSYGRAMLKTLELISHLYATLTASSDSLLSVFFSRSVNDLGVALFSEYCPRPLPNQPPLPNPSPLLAMEHYRKNTEREIVKAFQFLNERVRRDVIVVETVFGMTSVTRQQLLSQVTEGVVKPFVTQQIILAHTHENAMRSGEGSLSPRAKRRCAARVADAISYSHTMEVKLYTCFQDFIKQLKTYFEESEVDFLLKFVETIFANRAAYSTGRAELELLSRYYTIIDEKYTRQLHPVPDAFFDLREAHMTKTREMIECLTEVATRVRTYAVPKEAGRYVFELVSLGVKSIGAFLETELRKTYDSLRLDRDRWRLKPKSEDELLKPATPESQQCGFRMLLFAQSSLMSLYDSIAVLCMPMLATNPRLVQDIEEAKLSMLELLDEQAEKLLNMCAQAIIIRSLSILVNYQTKTDYQPRAMPADAVVPPCTRACTLFCYYLTRQLEECKVFIQLSNGQVPQKQTASQLASGATLRSVMQQTTNASPLSPAPSRGNFASPDSGGGGGASTTTPTTSTANAAQGESAFSFLSAMPLTQVGTDAVRARARTMNLQQLLYGDGGPSSFTRTLGVCLYRGISTHLKAFVVNDAGALIYKQDVTAYKESVAPLTSTPGLGGAVVETLFQLLKETSSLLIMPLDHIKEVKSAGLLKLMTHDEQMRFIKMRRDVRDAYKIINQ